MNTNLLKRMHFVSSPEYVAIEVEKDLLFTLWKKENESTKEELKHIQSEKDILFKKREKEINWTKYELEVAKERTKIFFQFGWDILKQVNGHMELWMQITAQRNGDKIF